MTSSLTRFLDHKRRRITVNETPLDEWSARRRDLYLTTQKIHNIQDIHALGWIGTHNLSRRAAANLSLRPCGQWGRHKKCVPPQKMHFPFFFLSRTLCTRFNRNTAHVSTDVQFCPVPAKKALIPLLLGSSNPDIQRFSTSWHRRHKLHLWRAQRIKSNWSNSRDLDITTIIF